MNKLAKIETKVCPTCGQPFVSYFVKTKFCSRKCDRYSFTPFDLKVIQEYKELCKKYHISAQHTYDRMFLTRVNYSRWETLINDRRYKSIAWKDQKIKMLQKFIKEFRAGYYELSPLRFHRGKDGIRKFWGLRNAAIKKLNPTPIHCPKQLSHCKGGIYPGDCPRNWKECALYAEP
jgi:hypothetical protein